MEEGGRGGGRREGWKGEKGVKGKRVEGRKGEKGGRGDSGMGEGRNSGRVEGGKGGRGDREKARKSWKRYTIRREGRMDKGKNSGKGIVEEKGCKNGMDERKTKGGSKYMVEEGKG